jgi:hypothetical protein
MKRITALLILALIIAAAIYVLGRKTTSPPPATVAAANTGARALTGQETTTFLPLICTNASTSGTGPSMTGQNYQYHCASLPDYPSGTGIPGSSDITLTSIIYGHITSATADQAYISYQGSFEPHFTNWGGGILFDKDSSGTWHLTGWYPGGQMDGCLALSTSGQAKMLCQFTSSGQGETDTSLWVITVPPSYDPNSSASAYRTSILKASDERETGMPNNNCTAKKSPDQAILLNIGNLTRSQQPGIFAQASIQYAAAADATSACAAGHFESVKTTTGTLDLKWDSKTVTVVAPQNFAPANW